MQPIKKQIISDENSQPIAVIIDCQDWQKIEALLQTLPEDKEDEAELWRATAKQRFLAAYDQQDSIYDQL